MRFRCRKYKYWISDYCLGALDKSRQSEIKRHIQNCSFCAKDVEFTREMVDLFVKRRKGLEIEITDEMSEELRAKVFSRIEKEEKRNENEQAELWIRLWERVPRFALG